MTKVIEGQATRASIGRAPSSRLLVILLRLRLAMLPLLIRNFFRDSCEPLARSAVNYNDAAVLLGFGCGSYQLGLIGKCGSGTWWCNGIGEIEVLRARLMLAVMISFWNATVSAVMSN